MPAGPQLIHQEPGKTVSSQLSGETQLELLCLFSTPLPSATVVAWSIPNVATPLTSSTGNVSINTSTYDVNHGGVIQTFTSTALQVHNASEKMAGTFICSASTSTGVAVASFEVIGKLKKILGTTSYGAVHLSCFGYALRPV